jgi:hypothetical protein
MDLVTVWNKVSGLPWCALVATGRTGSDALQSQLDLHPQIIGLISQSSFHDWWMRSTVVNYSGPMNLGDLIDEFIWTNIKQMKTRYDSHERKAELGVDQNQEIPMNLAQFRSYVIGLLEGQKVTSRNVLIAVYVAQAMALGQDMAGKKVFFHHIHHVRHLPKFMADFPDCKVIAMTRDPRAAYYSGVVHWRENDPAADSPAYPNYVLSRIVDEIQPIIQIGDRLRVMRLEDLDDVGPLTSLCHWLDVEYYDSVMESTWAGLRWWGDKLSSADTDKSMTEKEFVKAIRSSKWELKLSTIDKFVLRVLLNPQLRHYGYCPDRKPSLREYVCAWPALFLVTGFEAHYWRPAYILSALRERRPKDILRVFYHYLRRVRYFMQLYWRSIRGPYYPVSVFQTTPSATQKLLNAYLES